MHAGKRPIEIRPKRLGPENVAVEILLLIKIIARNQSPIVVRIHKHHLPDRAQIGGALQPVGLFAGGGNGGEKQPYQQGDDANDNQQLDEREGLAPFYLVNHEMFTC